MMLRNHGWLTFVTLAAIGIIGCGKSEGPVQQSAASPGRNVQVAASVICQATGGRYTGSCLPGISRGRADRQRSKKPHKC